MKQKLQTRVKSFQYAFQGMSTLFRTQVNAQIHLVAAILVVFVSFVCGLSYLEWAVVLGCIGWVWMAEAFNTALEFLTDLVSPEYHPLAGKAKDVAAGAVLISAIFAALMGGVILGPKCWALFFNV